MSSVLFETRGPVGIITLNREKALNSLNLEMSERLRTHLHIWEKDPAIKVIVLTGAGSKAFCAGGDVRHIYQSKDSDDGYAPRFFESEYRTDYALHACKKPLLTWGHGIVMGGGIGLHVGGSTRVVCENTVMAMPEITIGLYPDVGATHFLGRLPLKTALFVALTGARLNPQDALDLKLADLHLPASSLERLLDKLQRYQWSSQLGPDRKSLHTLVQAFSIATTEPGLVAQHDDTIQSCVHPDSLEDTYAKICALAQNSDPWLKACGAALKEGSPLSAHLIWRQFTSHKVSLKEAFQLELILSNRSFSGRDFLEGVRALLVDKDRKPKWTHPSLASVPALAVEELFTPPWPVNPLNNLEDLHV